MINFIENKRVQDKDVLALSSVSQMLNHWSNFGPVTATLESWLEQTLHLGDRKVVMTASGTAAIYALVGLKHYRAGKKLRWAIPALTFASLRQGPLADAIVLDVDEYGDIDLHELQAKKDEYDAFVVSNYMGKMMSAYRYHEFAENNGKVVIYDCATSLDRCREFLVDEAVSFHHTKPWGFGEGGCVVVKPEDLHAVRSIINCGQIRNCEETIPHGSNYKMSDVAAVYLLAWLNEFSQRKELYTNNYVRISKVARHLKIDTFGLLAATPGNVPLLFDKPTLDLYNNMVTLKKYYRPLEDLPMARKLYYHIVNFPCHPEMNLSDEQIELVLKSIR